MNIILELRPDDNVFVGYTEKTDIAEDLVVQKFKEVAVEGDELVKIEYEGHDLYTVRRKQEDIVEEDIEYVDLDGNPIEDSLDSDSAVQPSAEPEYDYPGEYIWSVRQAEEDKAVDIGSSDYYLLCSGPGNPFEENANVVITSV